MEAVMGETGEGSKEGADCSVSQSGEIRVNGEMNGSCEEDMEDCEQVTQHDAIVTKSLTSDVMSDKSVDDICENSLSDNASNCSKDVNNAGNFSIDEREDTKVPNNNKLSDSEVCEDSGTEVPGDEEDGNADELKDAEEGEVNKDEGMDVECGLNNETQGDNNQTVDHSVDDSDKEQSMETDVDGEVSSNERNHVRSVDKTLGSSTDSCEPEDERDVSESRDEEFTGRDNDKDLHSLDGKTVDPECEENVDDRTEKSETSNHIDESKEAVDSSKEDSGSSKEKDDGLKKNTEDCNKEGEKQGDSSVPDVEEISNDSVKSSKSIKSPANDGSEINCEAAVEKEDDATKKEGDGEVSDSKNGDTPGKVKKPRKSTSLANVIPRRSSRNLSKAQKSYVEKEEDPDIEEITPEDPLADPLSTDPFRDDKENSKTRNARKTTIVVNDTKRLVEIATGAKSMKGGKKEPTLVIIDTNSILSGRGPVPVSQPPQPPPAAPSLPPPPPPPVAPPVQVPAAGSSSGYSVLPVAVPAQGMYPAHTPMRINTPIVQPPPPPPPKPPQILPTLTDDMYVVEAPSFIVPYVYEKPPLKPLKEYIDKLGKELAEMKEKEEKEKREKEEKEKQEKEEKEKQEKEEKEKQEKEEKEKQEKEEKEKQEKEQKEKREKEEREKQDEEGIELDKKEKEEDEDKTDNENETDKDETEKNTKESNDTCGEKSAKLDEFGESSDSNHSRSKNEDKDVDSEKDIKTKGGEDEAENLTKPSEDKSSEEKKESEDSKKDENKSAPETRSVQTEDKDKPTQPSKPEDKPNKPPTYFDNPLGKFFMQIGVNLVQEYVQTDLLRSQKRKRDVGKGGAVTQFAINSLLKNLELSKENNEPFHLEQKKCEYCSFKTESSLVMAQHLETPHMRNYVYRCNFCPLEVRSPHDILFHMEAEHNVRGRLERAPAFHQCPNCPFEDNQKGKLTRHLLSCGKKYKPERNQEPPPDWEPPAKIPRVSRSRPASLGLGAAAYQAMAGKQPPQTQHHPLLPKLVPAPSLATPGLGRGRGRPPIHARYNMPDMKVPSQRGIVPPPIRQGMMYRPSVSNPTHPQMLLPTTYQIAGNQIYQVVGNQGQMMPMVPSGMSTVPRLTVMPPGSAGSGAAAPTPVALVPNIAAGNNSITIQSANNKNPAAKLLQQPSISITPLPRQPTGIAPGNPALTKHGQQPGGKATFVICEICDGYIKDLEQLRNHMQWIHKVKIHPKMIYNRPPLNCQKCQFRFFTDQGLERHLLGSHGLVTSSMQEAANKGKDGGRCPVCGRVYQWKLLNHVARDHNMTLKPAHLSYKCTVCTATFGMYKQFENHVYSAHSVVAKRVMDKKTPQVPRPPQQNDAILKPLKINDEITIIPQPARPRPGPASRTGAISAMMQEKNPPSKVHACENCEATFDGPAGFAQYLSHVRRRHLRRCGVKLCRLDGCPTCKQRHVTQAMLDFLEEQKEGVDVIELSDDEVVIAGQGRNEITITKVSCAPGPRRFKQRLQQSHNVQVIELEDSPVKSSNNSENSTGKENGEDSLTAVKERLRRRKSLEISQVDSECSSPQSSDDMPAKKKRRNDDD